MLQRLWQRQQSGLGGLSRMGMLGVAVGGVMLMQPVLAHEFWIEPHQFSLQPGAPLVADIRVGQRLLGNTQFFLPDKFVRFELIQGEQKRAVGSRTGDIPAVSEHGLEEGLAILAYQSRDLQLRYTKAEKFLQFLEYEGIDWVKAAHQQRGLPPAGFNEIYRRYSKSLIKVGQGQGEDQVLGMPVELVMTENPYQQDKDYYPVQLLWQGQPFANSQISVFFRADTENPATREEAERSLVISDVQGLARIPRPERSGVMLLNAVQMVEPDEDLAEKTKVVWVSLWASTTFYATPAPDAAAEQGMRTSPDSDP